MSISTTLRTHTMRKPRNKRQDTRPDWKIQQEEAGYIEVPKQKPLVRPLEAKTDNQAAYMKAIVSYKVVFGVGPAGTGKTYIAAAMAAQAFLDKEVEQIIITRPVVEAADEEMGFLPGELQEKYAPYLIPFLDVLNERLGKSRVQYMLECGQLEAAPLAYMRGRTFNRSFMILDEAQNTTPGGMKMFLTRIGTDSNVVVNGDITQKDIEGESGLTDAINRLAFIPSIKVVQFNVADIVRSSICGEIAHAYQTPITPRFNDR